ncbi:Microtubule-actin cross-linking factor 1 like protein [Gryllus bimaculatus]|nr:Microtubule-actin cross-linking factor 1 like protein [Gryllus bimaculatus]
MTSCAPPSSRDSRPAARLVRGWCGWAKDKPLSILQLDPADRAVLRIAAALSLREEARPRSQMIAEIERGGHRHCIVCHMARTQRRRAAVVDAAPRHLGACSWRRRGGGDSPVQTPCGVTREPGMRSFGNIRPTPHAAICERLL